MQKKHEDNYHQFYSINNLDMNESNLQIPIFPLKSVILLPGSFLPLNIFEKRYLNMIEDTLKTNLRLIGIVQPFIDNQESISSYDSNIGCYGKIVKFEENDNKTYLIKLKGQSRFKIIGSNLSKRGYISSKVSTEDFQNDLKHENNINQFNLNNDKRLKMILKSYLRFKKLDSNWDYINNCSNFDLINQLAMICPFSSYEKQMLLESKSFDDRYILLISILQNTVNPNEEQNEIRH